MHNKFRGLVAARMTNPCAFKELLLASINTSTVLHVALYRDTPDLECRAHFHRVLSIIVLG